MENQSTRNNGPSDIIKMRRQLKTVLLSYLLCGIVLLTLILLLHFTTSYYASSYPYSNITQLQHNTTTVALSVFNGYTEKVPSKANQTTIMQNIAGIRQEASTSVNGTIEELALAFILLLFFSIFSVVFGGKERNSSKLYLLPVIFMLALIMSQYALVLVAFIKGGSVSGISLFFVDSLAVIIWFGVLDEWLLIKAARRKKDAPGYITLDSLTRSTMVFLAVVLPLAVAYLTLLLLTNLGFFAYNSSFVGSYFAHSSGLLEFVIIFGFLFYYRELVAAIGKMRGRRARAPGKPPKAAIGARANWFLFLAGFFYNAHTLLQQLEWTPNYLNILNPIMA